MAEESLSWCLIESDPGVFTELIQEFGCEGVQVEEIWSLDTEIFTNLQPIHGLIFLFKWVPDDDPEGTLVNDDRLNKIFFAKQVMNNACATQAIVNILMNCGHKDIKLGSTLTEFKEFSKSFDPYNKGLTLSNEPKIRSVHNSFAPQTLYDLDQNKYEEDKEAYHFIGYLPIDGRLYELDGLKEAPVDLGPVLPDQSWIDIVRPIIDKRMKKYSDDEIHFNLMAVVSDRLKIYQAQIDKLMATPEGAMDRDDVRQIEIAKIHSLIEHELEKRKRYKIENIRRKHNYLPFIMALLKMLGEKKLLTPIYTKAKKRALEQQRAAARKK